MKIGIIGAGWVGASAALDLQKRGYKVTIFEKNADIFMGVSGTYGLRIHAGPHYPRSENTRKSCQRGLEDFRKHYPDLVVDYDYSIYGLGKLDVEGNPSKVDPATFKLVCEEAKKCCEINPEADKWGYTNLTNAFNVEESSAAVGDHLRKAFSKYLAEENVNVLCNYRVSKIESLENGKFIINNEHEFEHIVNATYYQDMLPHDALPLGIEAVYQPCLTIRYKDTQNRKEHSSFTVMDGMFVCLMSRGKSIQNENTNQQDYILYHAKYTILDSYKTVSEAQNLLNELKKDKYDAFIERYRPLWEEDIKRFYPEFSQRFEFVGSDTGIATKLRTEKDFRTAVTFKKDGIIYVFSGKINNIFDAADEISRLITTNEADLCCEEGYFYLKDGEFARSRNEMTEKPHDYSRNTCDLHTITEFRDLLNPATYGHLR